MFFVSENGNIPYPNNPSEIFGGHAVCAVGYSDESKKIKFKNSWGADWGKAGYGFVSYRYINDFLWDAWSCKDLSVTRKILKERAKDNLV
jgi:C1A family cysteine protease